jgi:KUP system potassium uptake protein
MVISTFLVGVVAIKRWRWRLPVVIGVFGLLGLVDLAFLSANTLKVVQGGWLPLAMAATVFILIDTWRVGRRVHLEHQRDGTIPIDLFLARAPAERVAGTAIFLAARTDVTPGPMLHSLKHYHVLHERVVLMSVLVEDVPFVTPARRAEVNKLGKGFFEVKLRFGFFEFPNVPQALERCRAYGLPLEADTSTFFLGRETLVAGEHPDIKSWRIALYTWLATNALSPARFFQLPPNRVVELGTQITI